MYVPWAKPRKLLSPIFLWLRDEDGDRHLIVFFLGVFYASEFWSWSCTYNINFQVLSLVERVLSCQSPRASQADCLLKMGLFTQYLCALCHSVWVGHGQEPTLPHQAAGRKLAFLHPHLCG